MGTSHFRCNSAAEVRSVILEEKPDGVVVELDPERVVRLTKEHALSSENQLFGADLLSAIDTARELDIPLFIGDEYTQETRQRFVQTILSVETYSPAKLLKSFRSGSQSKVNLLRAFVADPMKLAPLAISVVAPSIFLAVAMLLRHDAPPSSSYSNAVGSSVEIFLSLILSIIATSKVYNTFIADRDVVLASKAMNAAKVVTSLKTKETIRKTWTFNAEDGSTVGYAKNAPTGQDEATSSNTNIMMPLFTLKRPLENNAVRNLNLFEPRWLAMIDGLTKEEGEEYPQFGCVSCTNKFYSVVKKDGKEGRYADLIFQRTGRLATLVNVIEGSRPSGARKVSARIEGGQPFTVKEDAVIVSNEGYLIVTPKATTGSALLQTSNKDTNTPRKKNDNIKIVVVAGLLHVNGIVDTLASASQVV